MKKLAKKIQSEISDYCKKAGLVYNKNISSSKFGEPDIKIDYKGVAYYFEVKAKGDTLKPHQKEKIDILNKNKEVAFVIESFEDFYSIWCKIILKGE